VDTGQRDIVAKAVADRVAEDTKELIETVAAWAIDMKQRLKAWLWFAFALIPAFWLVDKLRLRTYVVASCIGALSVLFEWLLRWRACRKWQRQYFARQDFRLLLECRETLKTMPYEEVAEARLTNPDLINWFLAWFFPTSGMDFLLSEKLAGSYSNEENKWEGIFFPAIAQLKHEGMGLKLDMKKETELAEYAFKKYLELDPKREWIAKLRVRGGYVEA
jgi:hypothetical protein